jgi:hypothetical protein
MVERTEQNQRSQWCHRISRFSLGGQTFKDKSRLGGHVLKSALEALTLFPVSRVWSANDRRIVVALEAVANEIANNLRWRRVIMVLKVAVNGVVGDLCRC